MNRKVEFRNILVELADKLNAGYGEKKAQRGFWVFGLSNEWMDGGIYCLPKRGKRGSFWVIRTESQVIIKCETA